MLCKIKFTVNAGLSKKILVILFLTKVFAGVLNGWLSHAYPNADTWSYHFDAFEEYRLLFIRPQEYFTNLFTSPYNSGYEGMFQSEHSYWNDLKTNLMVKMVSVFHIFSGGNYYVNVILYNFLIFFGNVALFKVFSAAFKTKSLLLVAICFLLPSFLFFSSSIHKEGLIIASIGITLYIIHGILAGKKWSFKKVIFLLLSLALIFLLRNFVFIALLPAIGAWVISKRLVYPPIYIYAGIYLIGIVLFFTIGKIFPAMDLPQVVVDKQASFFELGKANTSILTDTLSPTLKSFVSNSPQAFNHVFLRPYFWEGKVLSFLYPLALEVIIYLLAFFVFLFFRNKENSGLDYSFLLFGVFFSISLLLIIGYTTPILGAIVRYRSIYLPFVLAPILLGINYKKIPSVLSIKK